MGNIRRAEFLPDFFVIFLFAYPPEKLSALASLLVFQDICIWFQVESEWLENIEMKSEIFL